MNTTRKWDRWLTDALFEGSFRYANIPALKHVDPDPEAIQSIDMSRCAFDRDALLQSLSDAAFSEEISVNFPLLIKYLCGESPAPEMDSGKLDALKESLKAELKSDEANSRWDKREPMTDKVRAFVNDLLDQGCTCDHAQVKTFAWRHFRNDPDVKRITREEIGKGVSDYSVGLTEKSFTILCKEIFQSRAPKRIFKSTLHKRSKACKIHFPA